MKPNLRHEFLLFISMLLVLIIALIGDRWINLLMLRAQTSFESGNFVSIAHAIGHFVIVGVGIFLYWLVIQKSPPHLVISLLFISVSFMPSFYNIFVLQFSFLDLKTINFLHPFSSSNLLLTASVFIAWIGFINLLRYSSYLNKKVTN